MAREAGSDTPTIEVIVDVPERAMNQLVEIVRHATSQLSPGLLDAPLVVTSPRSGAPAKPSGPRVTLEFVEVTRPESEFDIGHSVVNLNHSAPNTLFGYVAPDEHLRWLGIAMAAGEEHPETFDAVALATDWTPATVVERFLEIALPHARATRRNGSYEASERLIQLLSNLLEARDQLERDLEAALHDRDVALARLSQLEALYEALHSERFRSKAHLNWGVIANYAIAIATILGPVLAVKMAEGDSGHPAAAVYDTAQTVVQECGVTILMPGDGE